MLLDNLNHPSRLLAYSSVVLARELFTDHDPIPTSHIMELCNNNATSLSRSECMSGGISPEIQAHLRAYGLRSAKARESDPVIALDLHPPDERTSLVDSLPYSAVNTRRTSLQDAFAYNCDD